MSRPRPSSRRSGWHPSLHDPGLAKFRVAAAAAIAVAAAIAFEYIYATLVRPQGATLAIILGAVAAMQVSVALFQPRWQNRLQTSAWQALLVSASIILDIVIREVGGHGWELVVLVPLTFLVVWLRRYGAHFVTIGLMVWVGYYLGAFLKPGWTDLLFVVGAEVLSALVTFILSITAWGHRPRRALRHTVATWNRQIDVILSSAERLAHGGLPAARRRRLRRALEERGTRLTETALILEGWLMASRAEADWNPTAIRHQLIEEHLAVETITAAAIAASSEPSDLAATEALEAMGRAEVRLAELRAAWQQPVPADVTDASFSAVTGVAPGGGLPGPARVASQIRPRGPRGAYRLALTTRQAIQVTVALALTLPLGVILSPAHYAWSIMAVFIIFLGTSTRGDVIVKAAQRVAGTLLGLLVAMPLAWLVGGHALAVIVLAVVACFIGHYFMNAAYIYLMVCITIVIPQMYGLMGELDIQLLETRILETLLGAAIAVVVAMLVVPISTRDATLYIRRNLLRSVADFLAETTDAAHAGVPVDVDDIHRLARQIDDHARLLAAAAGPLTWNPGRRRELRHRLALYRQCARDAHRLAQRLTGSGAAASSDVALALRALAAEVLALSDADEPAYGRPTRGGDSEHPLVAVHRTLDAAGRRA